MSEPAHVGFIVYGARISVIGMAIWVFYLQGKQAAVDTMLALLCYVGVVDGYVCWREGVAGRAVERVLVGGVVAGWGVLGLTARPT